MTTPPPDRGLRIADRLTALCGLGAVVLLVLGIELAAPPPGPDASIASPSGTLAVTMAENAAAAETGVALGLGGVLLLTVFLGRLHGLLSATAAAGSSLPGATLLAGAAVVTAQLFGAGLAVAGTSPDGYRSDPAVAKAILALGWNSTSLFAPGLVALIVIWTVVAFTTDLLPRWLAWVGAALVALLVVLVGGGLYGVAVLPGFLWVGLLSVTLALRPPEVTASRSPRVDGGLETIPS